MRVLSKGIRVFFGLSGIQTLFLACNSSTNLTDSSVKERIPITFHIERKAGSDLHAPYLLEDQVVFGVQNTSQDHIRSVQASARCHGEETGHVFEVERTFETGVFPLHATLSLDNISGQQKDSFLTENNLESQSYECVFAFLGRSAMGLRQSIQNIKVQIPSRPRGGITVHHRTNNEQNHPSDQDRLTGSNFRDYHVTVFHTTDQANLTLKCSDFEQTALFDPTKNSKENLASFFDLQKEYEVLAEDPLQTCHIVYGNVGDPHWSWSKAFELVFEDALRPQTYLASSSSSSSTQSLSSSQASKDSDESKRLDVLMIDAVSIEPSIISAFDVQPLFRVDRRVPQNRSLLPSYGLEDQIRFTGEDDRVQSVQVEGRCQGQKFNNVFEVRKHVHAKEFPLHTILSPEQIKQEQAHLVLPTASGLSSDATQDTRDQIYQCDLTLVGKSSSGLTSLPQNIRLQIPVNPRGGVILHHKSQSITSGSVFLQQPQTSTSLVQELTDADLSDYNVSVFYPIEQGQITLNCSDFQEIALLGPEQNSKESLASLFNFQNHHDKQVANPLQTCHLTYRNFEDTHWSYSRSFQILFSEAFNQRIHSEVIAKMEREGQSDSQSNAPENYSLEDQIMFVHRRRPNQVHEQVRAIQASGSCSGQEFGNSVDIQETLPTNAFPLHAIISLEQLQFHPKAIHPPTREYPEQLAYMSDQAYHCNLMFMGITTTGSTTAPYQVRVEIPSRPRGGISIHHRQVNDSHQRLNKEGFTESDFEDYHVTVFAPHLQGEMSLKCSDFEVKADFHLENNSKRRLGALFPLQAHYEVLMTNPLQMCHIRYGSPEKPLWAWSQPFQILFEEAFEGAFHLSINTWVYARVSNIYWVRFANLHVRNPFHNRPFVFYLDGEPARGLGATLNLYWDNIQGYNFWSGQLNSWLQLSTLPKDPTGYTYLSVKDLYSDTDFKGIQVEAHARIEKEIYLGFKRNEQDFTDRNLNPAYPLRPEWFARNSQTKIRSVYMRNFKSDPLINLYMSDEKGHSFKPVWSAFDRGFVQTCHVLICHTYNRQNNTNWSILTE